MEIYRHLDDYDDLHLAIRNLIDALAFGHIEH